jgi:nicotinamidase/pyrazinamidase
MEKQYVVAKETASFDVDPQVGFSPLAPNELPVNDALAIVPELNAQAKKAQYRLASKDAHNPRGIWIATAEAPQFTPVGTPNVDIKWNRHCEVGTDGFAFLPGLPKPLDYDFVAYKGIEEDSHPYGACYHDMGDLRSTGVIEFLRQKGLNTVIVGGLATDFCVKTTALQLRKAGFDVIINLAACRAIDFNGSLNAALEEMKAAGIKIAENAENIILVR